MFGAAILIAIAALVVGSALLVTLAGAGQLRHPQLERFARRQHWIPTTNGIPLVAASLAVVRRWRRAGLAAGVIAGIGYGLSQGALTLSITAMFLGWFAGALVAEWRIADAVRSVLPQQARRSSTLTSRGLGTYVGLLARALAVGVLVAVVVAAVWSLAAALRQDAMVRWTSWTVVTALGLAVLGATIRKVVDRPAGYADRDLRDADDAVRCQSLTVIAGCAVAAAAYPLTAYLDIAELISPTTDLVITVVAMVVGWWIATFSPSTREPGRQGDPLADSRLDTTTADAHSQDARPEGTHGSRS